jgi:hypothetical protein
MSFSDDVARFAKRTNSSLDETGRGIALELFASVIKDTPADTGRARGSWQTTIGGPAVGNPRRAESAALSEVNRKTGQFKMGSVIYLTSNLVYIGRLEFGTYGTGPGATNKTTRDGFSVQAPYGMVRKNAARIQSIVSKAVRNNKL